MDKIVIGFSGGVDSAVSASILRERGYDVHGLYLETGGAASADEVRAAAEAMAIPLEIADARADLDEKVCRPFAEAYARGETPNPCVLCNPAVKFSYLTQYADRIGAALIATGHYARVNDGGLYMGMPENDQSYMLNRITRAQLSRLVLPLGNYRKSQVRALAAALALPAAQKPASMEICFIRDGDHAAWMEKRGAAPPPGDLIYNGSVVGRHGGVHRFTLGQRRGLSFSAGKRVYVSEIRPDTNEVVLADGDGLFAEGLTARDMNWLVDPPDAAFSCRVRVRHSLASYPATAVREENGLVTVSFDEPVRAPTRGQSAVLYDSERLLGGGFIL